MITLKRLFVPAVTAALLFVIAGFACSDGEEMSEGRTQRSSRPLEQGQEQLCIDLVKRSSVKAVWPKYAKELEQKAKEEVERIEKDPNSGMRGDYVGWLVRKNAILRIANWRTVDEAIREFAANLPEDVTLIGWRADKEDSHNCEVSFIYRAGGVEEGFFFTVNPSIPVVRAKGDHPPVTFKL